MKDSNELKKIGFLRETLIVEEIVMMSPVLLAHDLLHNVALVYIRNMVSF